MPLVPHTVSATSSPASRSTIPTPSVSPTLEIFYDLHGNPIPYTRLQTLSGIEIATLWQPPVEAQPRPLTSLGRYLNIVFRGWGYGEDVRQSALRAFNNSADEYSFVRDMAYTGATVTQLLAMHELMSLARAQGSL